MKFNKSNLPSRHVSLGPERAPHRSYYYAMGLDESDIEMPFLRKWELDDMPKLIKNIGLSSPFAEKMFNILQKVPRSLTTRGFHTHQTFDIWKGTEHIKGSIERRAKDFAERIESNVKKLAREKFSQIHLPKWFQFLEDLLIENKNSKWFVGSSMTIADLAIWRLIGWLKSGLLEGVPTSIVDPYKNLVMMRDEIYKHPKIKEWMIIKYGKEI